MELELMVTSGFSSDYVTLLPSPGVVVISLKDSIDSRV